MVSQRKIDANRRNALRSTGPRTAAGISRTRLNALRHGGYAKMVTPDESEKDLLRLQRAFLEHYHPASAVEHAQVLELGLLASRVRRYGRMEGEILTNHGFDPDPEHDQEIYYAGAGWAFSHDCTKSSSLSALSQVEDRIARRFRALKKDLDKTLQPEPGSKPAEVDQGPKRPSDSETAHAK
jgi:hypothetical protein